MQPFDCLMGKTIHHWRSVDIHLRAHLRDILTVIGCAPFVHKIHMVCIGGQYTASAYYHLHWKASRPLRFRATTIQSIRMMNELDPSWFSICDQQFTVQKLIDEFSIYVAWPPHHSSSSWFSLTSMTYLKQWTISLVFAEGLSGELGSWQCRLKQPDGCYCSGFRMCIDRFLYEWYAITDLKFVSKFCLKFRFCFIIEPKPATPYNICLLSVNLIWSVELSHGLYDPCIHTDEWWCLTICSLKSRNSRHRTK
jgi:hypothetical protein